MRVPIFEASGQLTPDSPLAAPYWAELQPTMPLAAEGLTTTPVGKITSVFSGSLSVTVPAVGLSRPFSGRFSAKSRPEALSAKPAVVVASTSGAKGTPSQPV